MTEPETAKELALPPVIENETVVALLREINNSLKVQNERLARIEARTAEQSILSHQVGGYELGEQRPSLERMPKKPSFSEAQRKATSAPAATDSKEAVTLMRPTMRLSDDLQRPLIGSSGREGRRDDEVDEDYARRVEQDLRESGMSEEQIAITLKNLISPSPLEAPTYTRMSREYISTETLDRYGVDWQFDTDPSFVLIRRWVPEYEQDFLWDHTKRLRDQRGSSFVAPYTEESLPQHDPTLQGTIEVRYPLDFPTHETNMNFHGILHVPHDHRLWIGFILDPKAPKHSTIAQTQVRRIIMSEEQFNSNSSKSFGNPLAKIRNFLRQELRSPHPRFLVRDADLHHNNRLYFRDGLIEYKVGQNPLRSPKELLSLSPPATEELPSAVDANGPVFARSGSLQMWKTKGSTSVRISPTMWHIQNDGLLMDPLPTPAPAPWRRIILLEGLEASCPDVYRNYSSRKNARPYVDLPFLHDQDSVISTHLEGGSHSFYKPPPGRATLMFQFSWYKIIPARLLYKSNNDLATIRWNAGPLYGTQHLALQEQVFTTQAIYRSLDDPTMSINNNLANETYWTMLVLAPTVFYNQNPRYEGSLLSDKTDDLPVVLLSRALEAIESMTKDWNEILDHLEGLLVGSSSILQPTHHDDLLFDDDSFSQSRTLWWVVDAADTFSKVMDECSKEYELFWNTVVEPDRQIYSKINFWNQEMFIIDRASSVFDKFQNVSVRVRNIKTRAMELRNGLFSASAVVEGRLATRLAQNVKLLTYVSIFYIPLAFSASLSPFNIPHIWAVFLGTALFTYFIVLNLDTLVLRGSMLYNKYRTAAINSMLQEDDVLDEPDKGLCIPPTISYLPTELAGSKPSIHDSMKRVRNRREGKRSWRMIGERFQKFEPKKWEPRPSEWLILGYTFMSILTLCGNLWGNLWEMLRRWRIWRRKESASSYRSGSGSRSETGRQSGTEAGTERTASIRD